MDPNTLFYTFSTISQTLATGLGLLAAVVMFRMDKLGNQLNETIKFLRQNISTNQFLEFCRDENWEGLGKYLEDDLGKLPNYNSPIYHESKNNVILHAFHVPKIKKELKISVVVTGIIILFSVSQLIFTSLISKSLALSTLSLALGFVSVGIALYRYFKLIKITIL